jgi:hypothetical protein
MKSSQLKESERNYEFPKKPKRAFDFFRNQKKEEYEN